MIKTLEDLLKLRENKMKLVVVACQDEDVIESVIESANLGITEPILIGDRKMTLEIVGKLGLSIEQFQFIDEPDLIKSAELGVRMVSEGKADFIMKGLVDTSILMKAVLNKEWGLRTESLISHVMVYEVSSYHKLLYLTDGGMNLEPSYEDKIKILNNSVLVAKAMGNEEVKVAVLAAKEKVNPKMKATVDADRLKTHSTDGGFGEKVLVEGPLALDLALSKDAANKKGMHNKVVGDADILLVPNIEMGNGIGKAITYLAGGIGAGVIMGAKVPIVLVSRADDKKTKLYSIALGNMVSRYLSDNNR